MKSRYLLEFGLSGRQQSPFTAEMHALLFGQFHVFAVPENVTPVPVEGIVEALATLEEGFQESGFLGVRDDLFLRGECLNILLARIQDPMRPRQELERLAMRLDQVIAARTSFSQTLDAQLLLERAEVLRVLQLRADPGGFIRRPPGWKEFFSWRIHVVKCLKELDDRHRFLRDEEGEPLRQWYWGINLKVPELEETRSRFEEAAEAIQTEIRMLAFLRFSRVALGLALFRAEHGAFPKTLAELVPAVLPAIPVHPFDDSPMVYENGVLKIKPSEFGDWIQWP